MVRIPPVAYYKGTKQHLPEGGPVYLLAWEHGSRKTALVAWLEVSDTGDIRPRRESVGWDELLPIAGQPYDQVPRRTV